MRDRLIAIFYWANIWAWIRLVNWLVISLDMKGWRNIPRRGPLILASNHLNLADPSILTAVMPRRMVWMAKKDLFDIPAVGLFCRLFGCIPVRRFEADLGALRRSERALRSGHVLGMFPEGTRSSRPGLQRAEPGTALLALKTGAPVLPVAIWGTGGIRLPRDFFRRTSAHLVFGKPFHLPKARRIGKEEVAEGTELIMREIAALLPPEYRGVYAEVSTDPVPAARKRHG